MPHVRLLQSLRHTLCCVCRWCVERHFSEKISRASRIKYAFPISQQTGVYLNLRMNYDTPLSFVYTVVKKHSPRTCIHIYIHCAILCLRTISASCGPRLARIYVRIRRLPPYKPWMRYAKLNSRCVARMYIGIRIVLLHGYMLPWRWEVYPREQCAWINNARLD